MCVCEVVFETGKFVLVWVGKWKIIDRDQRTLANIAENRDERIQGCDVYFSIKFINISCIQEQSFSCVFYKSWSSFICRIIGDNKCLLLNNCPLKWYVSVCVWLCGTTKTITWGNAATVCGAVGSLPGLWGNFTPSSFTKKDRGAAEHLWSFGVAGGEETDFYRREFAISSDPKWEDCMFHWCLWPLENAERCGEL